MLSFTLTSPILHWNSERIFLKIFVRAFSFCFFYFYCNEAVAIRPIVTNRPNIAKIQCPVYSLETENHESEVCRAWYFSVATLALFPWSYF